jgi:hypothetical protein
MSYRVDITDRNHMSTTVFKGQLRADAQEAYMRMVDIARAFRWIDRVAIAVFSDAGDNEGELVIWTSGSDRAIDETFAYRVNDQNDFLDRMAKLT